MSIRNRWLSLDFLAFCDLRIRAFYDYWNGKRGGRPMPSRSDLDPAEIISFLPSVMMSDVVDKDSTLVRYRLIGTRETEARGGDPTGLLVHDAFHGRSRDYVLKNYWLVIGAASPLYDCDPLVPGNDALVDRGTILVPLSDDGVSVSQVLAYAALDNAPSATVLPRRNDLSRYPGRGKFASPR
jgi:PAS domain